MYGDVQLTRHANMMANGPPLSNISVCMSNMDLRKSYNIPSVCFVRFNPAVMELFSTLEACRGSNHQVRSRGLCYRSANTRRWEKIQIPEAPENLHV